MTTPFFPESAFAWVFCIGLIVLLGIAAWTDTRTARIPNRLTMLILILGLVINVVRAGWMGSEGKPLWQLETGSASRGAFDGLLFSLAGAAVVFALMFIIWILNMCGGGDVKLLTAVAAWVGLSKVMFLIWLGSVVVLFFWIGARVLTGGMSPRKLKRTMEEVRGEEPTGSGPKKEKIIRPGPLRVTYSVPIAVSALIALPWLFRYELQLVPPKPQPAQQSKVVTHDSPQQQQS